MIIRKNRAEDCGATITVFLFDHLKTNNGYKVFGISNRLYVGNEINIWVSTNFYQKMQN